MLAFSSSVLDTTLRGAPVMVSLRIASASIGSQYRAITSTSRAVPVFRRCNVDP